MRRKQKVFRKCPKCHSHCSLKHGTLYCRKCGFELKNDKNNIGQCG